MGIKCNIKGDRMKIEAGKEEVIKYSYICDICGKGTEHHRVCSICNIWWITLISIVANASKLDRNI